MRGFGGAYSGGAGGEGKKGEVGAQIVTGNIIKRERIKDIKR